MKLSKKVEACMKLEKGDKVIITKEAGEWYGFYHAFKRGDVVTVTLNNGYKRNSHYGSIKGVVSYRFETQTLPYQVFKLIQTN